MELLVLSAQSAESLERMRQEWRPPVGARLADVAWTLQVQSFSRELVRYFLLVGFVPKSVSYTLHFFKKYPRHPICQKVYNALYIVSQSCVYAL